MRLAVIPLVLPLVLVAALRGSAASAGPPADDLGARIYAERCSACHGDDGRGDGLAAAALVPRPADFRTPEFWRDRTPDRLRAAVTSGKPGTMMAPFQGVLSGEEIDAVVEFLGRFDPSRAKAPSPGAPAPK